MQVSRLFSNQGQRHEDEEAEELCHENRGHQQQNTAMASKYNKLQELNRKLVAKSTNLEYENKALKSENMNIMQQNHDLDFDYRKLSQDYKMLYDGYMALLTDHEGTDAQISALIAEKAKLNERLTAFRQMLVPAAEGQVSDSEIVRKFGTIRSQIMGLVRQNWMIQLKQNIRLSDATKEQADFFGGLECTSTNLYWKHCPYERLQQEVSRLLLNTIFNRRPYFLSADYRGIQSYLAAAEKAIWESVTNLRGMLKKCFGPMFYDYKTDCSQCRRQGRPLGVAQRHDESHGVSEGQRSQPISPSAALNLGFLECARTQKPRCQAESKTEAPEALRRRC